MTIKPPLIGLIDRQDMPFRRWIPYVRNYVIKVSWKYLQPKISGGLNYDLLDRILDAQVANGSPWSTQRAALRVSVGSNSPDWVYKLAGTINWEQGTSGSFEQGGPIPQFWNDGIIDAYTHLQELLSARYDDDYRIARVDLGLPVSLYSPEVCGIGATKANRNALAELGWAPEIHTEAFKKATSIHESLWQKTPTAAAFAPVPQLNGARSVTQGLDMMNWFKTLLGERACILTTFAAPSKLDHPDYKPFLDAQGEDSTHSCVQTASWTQLIEDTKLTSEEALAITLQRASQIATSVELPQRYATVLWPENSNQIPDKVKEVMGSWI